MCSPFLGRVGELGEKKRKLAYFVFNYLSSFVTAGINECCICDISLGFQTRNLDFCRLFFRTGIQFLGSGMLQTHLVSGGGKYPRFEGDAFFVAMIR